MLVKSSNLIGVGGGIGEKVLGGRDVLGGDVEE